MKLRNLILMVAAAAFFSVACDKENPERQGDKDNQTENPSKDPTGTSSDDPTVDPNAVMTPVQIKQKLEDVGLEVLSYAELDNWKWGMESFVLMGNLMAGVNPDSDGRNKDDEIDNGVFEEILADVYYEDVDEDGWTNTYANISLSEVHGLYQFDEKDLYWSQDDGDGLVFDAPYKDTHLRLSCTAEDYPDEIFVASGERYRREWWTDYRWLEIERNLSESRWESEGYDDLYIFYDPETGQTFGPMKDTEENRMIVAATHDNEVKERLDFRMHMPKKVTGTLVRDDKEVLGIEANVEYECGNADNVLDPETDRFALSTDFVFQDYDLEVTRTNYSADEGNLQAQFKYKGTAIMTVKVNEKGIASKRIQEKRDYEDIEQTEPGQVPRWGTIYHYTATAFDGPSEPTAANIDIDILGKIQIKGECDVVNLMKNIDKAYDSDDSEATFKSYITQAEQCFTLEVFFDGGSTAQATLGLEPDKVTRDGRTYLRVLPVIRFADGTSYAVLESFFDPEDFKNLIEAAERWADSVEEYLEELGVFRKESSGPIDPNEDLNGDGIPDNQQDYDGDGTPDWMQY